MLVVLVRAQSYQYLNLCQYQLMDILEGDVGVGTPY
jgi:hypothetical protein